MRVPAALALAALLLCAGCAAFGGSAPTAEPTRVERVDLPVPTSRTPTATETPTAAPALAYEDLSDRERAAFRDAMDGEVTFAPTSPNVSDAAYALDHAEAFRDTEYVRHEGQRYRVALDRGATYAAYGLELAAENAGGNATTVAFENLSTTARYHLERAVERGEYTVPYGVWTSPPAALADATHLRYENETYALRFTSVADAPSYTLTARAAG